MLTFILTLYIVFGMLYLTIKYGVRLFFYSLAMLVAFPFGPFIVASRIKKEKPFMSKTLMVLWSLVYLVLALIIFLYWKTA